MKIDNIPISRPLNIFIILNNKYAEDIEKARLQINYQLICTALEKAIIETLLTIVIILKNK